MNSFQFILILSVCVCKSIYEFYSIKPFYFTENLIYVKLDPEAANTGDSYHLKSGSIYSQWDYLAFTRYGIVYLKACVFYFLSNFYLFTK